MADMAEKQKIPEPPRREGSVTPEVTGTAGEKVKTSAEVRDERKKSFENKKGKINKARVELAEKKKAIRDIGIDVDAEYPEEDAENKRAQEYFREGDLKTPIEHKEKSEEEGLLALKEKHDAEMQEVLEGMDLKKLDANIQENLHADFLLKKINLDRVPEEVKKLALKEASESENGNIDISKLSEDEKNEIIQRYQAKKTLQDWSKLSPKERVKTEKLAEFQKQNPAIADFLGEEAGKNFIFLTQQGFLDEAKKNPIILKEFFDSIKSNGVTSNGIDPTTSPGKEIIDISGKNLEEFFTTFPEKKDLKDIADVFPGIWNDVIAYTDFPIPENLKGSLESIRKAKEAIESGDIGDVSPENLPEEIKKATGLSPEHIAGVGKSVKKYGKLSPLVKFFADLIAPFGAMMGGEVGDFWRQYLNQQGSGSQERIAVEGGGGSLNQIGFASGQDFVSRAATYLGRPYTWGGDGNGADGGLDCSGLVVKTLQDVGCTSGGDATARDFRTMSEKVKPGEGGVGDFLITETANGASHIRIIEKNNGNGNYTVVEAAGSKEGIVRKNITAGGNIGVYRNPFIRENEQLYAGRQQKPMSQSGRQKYVKEDYDFGNELPADAEVVTENISLAQAEQMLKMTPEEQKKMSQKDGKLVLYRVKGAKSPSGESREKTYIAVHGTAAYTRNSNGELIDGTGKIHPAHDLDLSSLRHGHASGLYQYFVSKSGIPFQFFDDTTGSGCVSSRANNNTGIGNFNSQGIAIEVSLAASRDAYGVEAPNGDQHAAVNKLVGALRKKHNIGAGNIIASDDPVRDANGNLVNGAHNDSFRGKDRQAMGMASAMNVRQRLFDKKTFFEDDLSRNGSGEHKAQTITPRIAASPQDGQLIDQIKQNESGNTNGNEGYAWWNSTEKFPSMGFAHFIWGTDTGQGNSFHDMMKYITTQKGITVPPDLTLLLGDNPPSSWRNLNTMQKDSRYKAITDFLSKPEVKYAGYDYIRNSRLKTLQSALTGSNLEKFNILAKGPKGTYILTDYVNFKGEGLGKNSSWGLKQVLEKMPIPSDPLDAAKKFRDAASGLLKARSDSAQYGPGWDSRLRTYI